MILRRFAKALKEQNWTAIWIEFVLLVAGVFLGIQVSNWNEDRANARLAQDYLRRLHADFENDKQAVGAEIAYYSQVRDSALKADQLLQSDDADPRELVISAYRATEISYLTTVHATWDQIVSSGHLGLLPADIMETGIPKYYAQNSAWNDYSMLLQSDYRQRVRETIPLAVQIAIRNGCSDERDAYGYIAGFSKSCTLEIDPDLIEAAARALREDPAIRAGLRYQYGMVQNTVQDLVGVANGIDSSLAAMKTGAGTGGAAPP